MTKILFYDIETAPNLSYVWGHYEQDVVAHRKEWYILCVSYQWLGEKDVHVAALCDWADDYASDPENDFNVVQVLWHLIDEADIVIAHNGDKFDMRKANARFAYHRLGPPSPVRQIDTLKVARKHFMFNSNRLGDLGTHLGVGTKRSTGGFGTWAGCMRGDPSAWQQMKKYAKQDIVVLRNVYTQLRPWMTNHPNVTIFDDSKSTMSCPTCGSLKIQKRGFKRTQVASYQQFQCLDCKSYSRSRLAEKGVSQDIIP